MNIARTALAAVLLIAAPMAFAAGPYSSFYVIPAAGHTAGAHNTFWVSDVSVQNPHAEPLEISFVFVQSGEGNPDNTGPVTLRSSSGQSLGTTAIVPARGTMVFRDLLAGYGGLPNVTGALMVGAAKPFAVVSRSYNSTTRVGQAVDAFQDFLDNSLGTSDNTATAYVAGVTANSTSRTNLGFAAATANTSAAMVVAVRIRSADGTLLGTRNFTIPAGGALQHRQFSSLDVFNGSFDLASAEFQIVSGNGSVVPYASVVDNATADGVFVGGRFPANAGATFFRNDAALSAFRMAFDRASRE